MTPTALSLPPAVIAGARDDGTNKIKSNSSCPSTILSIITGTLKLLIVIPLANVVVSLVESKSTPPVSQLFLDSIIIMMLNMCIITYLQLILVIALMGKQ